MSHPETPQVGPDRLLSRLEHAVLGLVWRGQPCTAYSVRQQFKASPSSHFSGSAGAVYPALQRLQRWGLLSAESTQRGTRNSYSYAVTDAGIAALRAWLNGPLPDEDVSYSFDPLRTRVYYLALLGAAERLRFVQEALERTRAQAALVEADYDRKKAAGDRFLTAGVRGVLCEVQARVAWLEEIASQVASGDD